MDGKDVIHRARLSFGIEESKCSNEPSIFDLYPANPGVIEIERVYPGNQ